jgi:hypothetical protein
MIEIKITVDAALNLLLERMQHELKIRQKDGLIPRGIKLENLTYSELISIIETSVFDTVFLLPIEIIRSETNLAKIVSEAVRALSKALHREEFQLYSQTQAKKIISSIKEYIDTNSAMIHPGSN